MSSSNDNASSIALSMYNYDESSSGSSGGSGSDDDNTSNYDDETQEDNALAQYKMPSMGTIPTVAPGRDRSRLPTPVDGDESTFSSAAALTSAGAAAGGGGTHDGDNNSSNSSSSGAAGGDGYYNDDATMTSRTSASLMDMAGHISSQLSPSSTSSKKMKITEDDTRSSPEFTVQNKYHASTDTFPTSNVAGQIGGGGRIGDGGGLRMERSAHRSKHHRHHHHHHHKSSQVQPRGVEPSPFLPYNEEEIIVHHVVGGDDETPPPDPNLKPGEGLDPYLPYDTHSDEEYTPSEEEEADEVHLDPRCNSGGSDKKSSQVQPRGVEPSPFLPYNEEDMIVHHVVRGEDETPPPDPHLKPGEGLKPYLPYDTTSDQEYTSSEEEGDETNIDPKYRSDDIENSLHVNDESLEGDSTRMSDSHALLPVHSTETLTVTNVDSTGRNNELPQSLESIAISTLRGSHAETSSQPDAAGGEKTNMQRAAALKSEHEDKQEEDKKERGNAVIGVVSTAGVAAAVAKTKTTGETGTYDSDGAAGAGAVASVPATVAKTQSAGEPGTYDRGGAVDDGVYEEGDENQISSSGHSPGNLEEPFTSAQDKSISSLQRSSVVSEDKDEEEGKQTQSEMDTEAAVVGAGVALASVGKNADPVHVTDTSGIKLNSSTTTERGESQPQDLSNTSDEEKDGKEDRDLSVAAGAAVLASAAAARDDRSDTESTIGPHPNVAGSNSNDITPQQASDADNDKNDEKAMSTSEDSENFRVTAAATSTLSLNSTGRQHADPDEIASESHDTSKESDHATIAADVAKDVAAIAAVATLTDSETEEAEKPIPVNESSNAQEDAAASSAVAAITALTETEGAEDQIAVDESSIVQEDAVVNSLLSRSLVSQKESESIQSTVDEVKSSDAPLLEKQGVLSNANDIEEGAVRDEQEGTPVGEFTVSQKSAIADDGSETSRTKPAIWIARGVLVASVIVIVVLSAIFIPRRENEQLVPTIAPTQVSPTIQPSLPPSSSILPVPTTPTPVSEPTGDIPTMAPSQIQQTPSPVLTTAPTILPPTPPPFVETPSPTVEMINDFEASSIFGGRNGNEFGTTVSLTSDGNFLAVLNLNPSDPVQAFSYRDTVVDGEDIEVWNALSFLPVTIFDGTSDSVSGADVSTAVLPSGNSVVALSSMYGFEVFELIDNERNGTAWNKKGPSMQWESPIAGIETKVKTTSISFSDDGSILTAGFINEGQNVATISVFRFNEQTESWVQTGDVISKPQPDMLPLFLGITLSLSGDGTVVAVGTSADTTPSVTVDVLRLEATSWTPMGDQVELDSGSLSLDLSQNGRRLAAAVSLPGSGAVYEFDSSTMSWGIVSNPFLGGSSISMNSAGTRVVVGGSTVNIATVYSNIDGSGWKASSELSGDVGSRFGYSVSMAGNGNRIAVGAPEQDQGEGTVVGRVVFYE